MLKVTVDVDIEAPGVVAARSAHLGKTFPIVLMVEHGCPESCTPVVFDTLILEVLFNDREDVLLRVDPNERPSAGELAANSATTIDTFSREPVKAGYLTDKPAAFAGGSRLTLQRPKEDYVGPYRDRTGRAGLSDFQHPFVLEPGAPAISFALGKVEAGLSAVKEGSSSITAVGQAFLGSVLVPIRSVRGSVRVIGK